jgi:hypothetical protein
MSIVESGIDTTVIKQSSKRKKINKQCMFFCIIYFTDGAAVHVGSAFSSGEMEQKFLAFPMPNTCPYHFNHSSD